MTVATALFKWYQKPAKGAKNAPWIKFLASQEDQIIQEHQPAFVTILAADSGFDNEEGMTADAYAKVKYQGDLYIDIDAETIEEGIKDFRKMLGKLEEDIGLHPSQCYLYATGSKGFHCIIPRECFIEKKAIRHSFASLPEIYKEMTKAFSVDSLDERVYTAKRGRMFRVPNIERPDKEGVYKVQITLNEAMDMTPEMYKALCSKPRHPVNPDPPSFNQTLAIEFAEARERVNRKTKENLKRAKETGQLRKRYPKELPSSVLNAFAGTNLNSDKGFNDISLQLAIVAHELKMSQDDFVNACENLCQTHSGTKYKTYQSRRDRLVEAFHHTEKNVCYAYSLGGLKSILAPGLAVPDLEEGADLALGAEDLAEDALSEEADFSLTLGMRITRKGIFRKTETGFALSCSVGMSGPKQLIDTATGDTIGYEVDTYVDGKSKGRVTLSMDTFLSRTKFSAFALNAGGSTLNATDLQVGALAEVLRTRVAASNAQVFTTSREGIDVIRLPDGDYDIVWADLDKVTTKRENASYRLVGNMSKEVEYRTNLRNAPELVPSDDAEEFYQHLFRINVGDALGKMIGWYFAAFFNQPLRYLWSQFPSLQVYGAAGSGKTKTNELLINLHYYNARPRIQGASSLTPWVFDKLLSSSGSVPLILDEYKPRAMRKDRLDKLRMVLNENYTGVATSRGTMSSASGTTKVHGVHAENSAPLVVIGEALESTTSIVERGVIVPLDKMGKRGHASDFMYCQSASQYLSMLGRHCMEEVMSMDLSALRKRMVRNIETINEAVGERAGDNDRAAYNMAVVLLGLDFAGKCLNDIFGTTFNAEIQRLKEAVMADKERLIPRAMSEANKVLDTLAYLSNANPDDNRDALIYGIDYTKTPARSGHPATVDLHLRNAFHKYVKFKRTLGEESLFDNYEAFAAAMGNYAGVVDKFCIDNPMKDNPTVKIFAFDAEHLADEGVTLFKVEKN